MGKVAVGDEVLRNGKKGTVKATCGAESPPSCILFMDERWWTSWVPQDEVTLVPKKVEELPKEEEKGEEK